MWNKIAVNQHQIFVLESTNPNTYSTKLLPSHTLWKPCWHFKLFEIFIFFYFQILRRTNMVRNIRRKQDACEDERWISFCSLNKLIRFWPNIWPTVHFLFSCLPKENVLNKMNICYSQHSKILIIYPGFMLTERTKLRGKKNVYVANSLPNNF